MLCVGFAAVSVRVYPRACGGTGRVADSLFGPGGLSPRVRGNRRESSLQRPGTGSIPARAGEPHQSPPHGHPQEVYPRACGGTLRVCVVCRYVQGLSPRVRGNPIRKPLTDALGEVYPRACGGTARDRVYPRACGGRSAHTPTGSIPARAGEPR